MLRLLGSWLEEREAVVVVDGAQSKAACLRNMVFQGSVWGPPLWNVYFADAQVPVQQAGFDDTFFADDLCSYREFFEKCDNKVVKEEIDQCQKKT